MKKPFLNLAVAAGLLFATVSSLRAYDEVSASDTGDNKILIIVKQSIYLSIKDALSQYISDLEAENYRVILVKSSSSTAKAFREDINSIYSDGKDLQGAILIGTLPSAKIKVDKDYILTDIYYMDLDGTWTGNDKTGKYTAHSAGSGDVEPEIWVSRLSSKQVSGSSEIAFLKRYLTKNNDYRLGELDSPPDHKGLVYLDDDSSSNTVDLTKAYNTVDTHNTGTTASGFEGKLTSGHEYVHLESAKVKATTSFSFKNGDTTEKVSYGDMSSAKGLFYVFLSPWSGNYAAVNYIAGHSIFSNDYGLIAIADSGNGSFSSTEKIYEKLSLDSRKNFGEGFLEWFKANQTTSTTDYANYGLILFGDPTLSIDPPIAAIGSIEWTGSEVSFSGSGTIKSGSIASYKWRSDKDGDLSENSSFNSSSLSNGAHSIYFKVKDSLGRWSSEAQTSFTYTNTALPTITITQGDEFYPDESYTIDSPSTVTLTGTATASATGGSITEVTWANQTTGGSGTATGTTNWTASGISINEGTNTIKITATDSVSNQGFKTITVKRKPLAPTNLTAKTEDTGSVSLNWESTSTSATNFAIYRKLSSDNAYSELNTVSASVKTYSDATCKKGKTYNYAVFAYNSNFTPNKKSAWAYVTIEIPTDVDKTAPTGTISINSGNSYTKLNSVTLALSATDTIGVKAYYVNNATSVDATTSVVTCPSTPGKDDTNWQSVTKTTSYTANIDHSLPAGDALKGVCAWFKDGAGNVSSACSDTITLDKTSPTPGTMTITGATGSATGYTNTSAVTLNLSATDNLSGVKAYYASESSTLKNPSWNNITTPATSYSGNVSYTLSSGNESKTVYVWFKDAAGMVSSSKSSAEITLSTAVVTAPSKPTGLGRTIDKTGSKVKVVLEWTDNSSDEAGFSIERKKGSSGDYSEIKTPSSATATDNITSLDSGTYYYRVRAYKNASTSDKVYSGYSDEVYYKHTKS